MKIGVTTVAIMFFALSLGAQENAITKHFSKHQQDDQFTKISVTSKMFSLFTELDAELEEEKDLLEAISKLKGIKGLFNDNVEDAKSMYKDAIQKIDSDGTYEELMTVENIDDNAKFLIRDEGGKISELLMVMGGKKEFIAMSLFGDIELSAISKLAKVMKIRGLEHFGQLHDH